MTQLAHIPPYDLMGEYVRPGQERRNVHMFLPGCVKDYKQYQRLIWKVNEADLTILDNGAFEGNAFAPIAIMRMAKELQITELVVPDVMQNGPATMEAIRDFKSRVVPMFHGSQWPKQYMAVVQGKTFQECTNSIREIARYVDFGFIRTLGLPKHLLKTTDDKRIRLELCKFIRNNYRDRFQIHFLGASPVWHQEIGYAWPYDVRSMDTSMAFVYAHEGTTIGNGDDIERPPGFFKWLEEDIPGEILARNVHLLTRWATRGLP